MNHSYEEIRSAAIDILARRESTGRTPEQFLALARGVVTVLAHREMSPEDFQRHSSHGMEPSQEDGSLFLEVFWDLFRQGIITLGLNDMNPNFPWFRVSRLGERILAGSNPYLVHDISTYTATIQREIPHINAVTLIYLQEAMQAFRAGCILSATVMLGVASEHTFDLLLETIESSPAHAATFRPVFRERMILKRFNKFRDILEQQLSTVPPNIKEDLDTQFAGILSLIRNFRNESGHPTGKIIDREQCFVLLNLFIPYCRKMYQLRGHFNAPGAAPHP